METLDKRLFSGRRLTDERRNDIDIVFNATELRTGTAFRFGSRESGCWRYGKLSQNDVSLAKVVASSAMYPLAFPALDEVFSFIGKSGQKTDKRVLLTDGGVYDNLGVSCFEPGKSPDISSNVYSPDYLIVCDAGRGVFTGEDMPSWFIPRTVKSFDTTFRKAHDATISRLFHFKEHGQLKGFVLSYLGQQDNRLPYLSTDLVRLDEVRTCGTDLSAMKQEKIDAIAKRGEQLTTLLLNHYLPDL
jgi:NTE family protein